MQSKLPERSAAISNNVISLPALQPNSPPFLGMACLKRKPPYAPLQL